MSKKPIIASLLSLLSPEEAWELFVLLDEDAEHKLLLELGRHCEELFPERFADFSNVAPTTRREGA